MKLSTASYLQHCRLAKNLSPLTIKAYAMDLAQFTKYVGEIPVKDIQKSHIGDFIQTMMTRGFKDSTIVRKIATLKAFFRHLENEEDLITNPFQRFKIRFKSNRQLPRTIDISHISSILNVARLNLRSSGNSTTKKIDNPKNVQLSQNLLVVELLFYTGMRVSEICNMELENVDLNKKSILVKGKGNRERMIIISHDGLSQLLCSFASLRQSQSNDSKFLFLNTKGRQLKPPSIRSLLKHYTLQADIKKNLTPHMFRHTIATLMIDNGIDIRIVQEFLGHSSIVTTQRYCHVTEATQRNIIATKHPRNTIPDGANITPIPTVHNY